MTDGFDHKVFLKQVSSQPGVYRMLNAQDEIMYVGKARNLKNRLSSYFVKNHHSARIANMVQQIDDIQVAITHTEAEALLLESNLIKEHRPKYNILLRDDKSYPHIYLSSQRRFPSLSFHRGSMKKKGQYFGPYASAGAVRSTLNQLQKVFRVRQCEESYFSNRTRPCLQYQIDRCTGPCVGLVSEEDYANDVADTVAFLEGKSESLIQKKVSAMEQASMALKFEEAARFRDQIELLRSISEQQYVAGKKGNVDVVALDQQEALACVQVFMIRQGNSLGNRSFFPKMPQGAFETSEILEAFLGQYYAGHEVPAEILLSHELQDVAPMTQMLSMRRNGKVKLSHALRGERARWMQMAQANARASMESRLSSKATMQQRFEALQGALGLDFLPARMECFDISHTQGEATVASCVVFNSDGPLSADYRRFNISGITPGDDYAAMDQALSRRYTRVKEGEVPMPDILFIDGGKGQLTQARKVLKELQVVGVVLVGVAKGEGRKPGLETLFVEDDKVGVQLGGHSPALHLVQHIRDEAHRFAITGHRQRRAKQRVSSSLEGIEGLGPKRRQTLLKQFGGLRGIKKAGVEELAKTPGVSRALAERIYASFHATG